MVEQRKLKMARNRVINPEFWLDEELSRLTPMARLLYIGLWGICDDNYATFPDREQWIGAQIFPYEYPPIRPLLDELSALGKIIKFQENDKNYWFIKNFFKYQTIDRPSKPKYPEYKPQKAFISATLDEYSMSTRPEAKLNEVNNDDFKKSQKSSLSYELRDLDSDGMVVSSKKKSKVKENPPLVRIAKDFIDRCNREVGVKPILDKKTLKVISFALNTGGLKELEIYEIFDDWFRRRDKKNEDLVQITQVLSTNNINRYRANL